MRRLLLALLWLVAGLGAAQAASPAVDGASTWQTHNTNADLVLTLTTASTNDVIVVGVAINAGAVTSITDTAGLTFTQRKAIASPNPIEEWVAKSTGTLTADVITVHISSTSTYVGGGAFGVSGTNFTTPIDPGTSNGPKTLGNTAASVSTTLADDLIVGLYRFSTASPTAGAGFTAIIAPASTSSLFEYQSVSSPQTNLSVAIGTGNTSVSGGLVDAFTSDATTTIQGSKTNAYSELSNGTSASESASKVGAFGDFTAGTAASESESKQVVYVVLKSRAQNGFVHSFPP